MKPLTLTYLNPLALAKLGRAGLRKGALKPSPLQSPNGVYFDLETKYICMAATALCSAEVPTLEDLQTLSESLTLKS